MAERPSDRTDRSTDRRGARGARTRTARAVALPVALTAALAGCSATNDMTTLLQYDASDGVRAEVGDVAMGNLVVLTSEEGAAGALVGYATNRGGEDASVTVTVGGDATTVRLDPQETVHIGGDENEPIALSSVPAPPGAFVELTLTSGAGGTTTARVPVMDDTLPEYEELLP